MISLDSYVAVWIVASILLSVSRITNGNKFLPLPEDYDKDFPPITARGNPVDVKIDILLLKLAKIDERHGEIELIGYLRKTWIENRLADNVTQYRNIRLLDNHEMSNIWTPDINIQPMKGLKVMKDVKDMAGIFINNTKHVTHWVGFSPLTLMCSMDFTLYPMDVHECEWSISSFRYPKSEVVVSWISGDNFRLPHGDGRRIIDLAKFTVEIIAPPPNFTMEVPSLQGNSMGTRLRFIIYRKITTYIWNLYFPTMILVMMSWGSFFVVPEVVPGRMVLLVTNVLTLVHVFMSVRSDSPGTTSIKAAEYWLISCIVFVSAALAEYCIVLCYIRYQQIWKKQEKAEEANRRYWSTAASRSFLSLPWSGKRALKTAASQTSIDMDIRTDESVDDNTPKKEEVTKDNNAPMNRLEMDSPPPHKPCFGKGISLRNKLFFLDRIHNLKHGRLDLISLVVFPLSFVVFNFFYWIGYCSKRNSLLWEMHTRYGSQYW